MSETMTDGRAAFDAMLTKVRERLKDAPFFVDHGGGYGGSTVVSGPTLRVGFILQSIDDKRAEDLAEKLNGAWAYGYEQGSADAFERGKLAGKGAIPNEADLARAERNGLISRLRARWPHIHVPAKIQIEAGRPAVVDPGPPTCLRCCIEDVIGQPWHDGLGPSRNLKDSCR